MRIAKLVAALLLFSTITAAWAQNFPSRPIKIVIPFPPGGATDLFARSVGEGFQKAWNVPVIYDNRPGASGMIGAEYVSKSPPDGYTLMISAVSLHSILPVLMSKMAYESNAFTPISLVVTTPAYLVVPASSPAHSTAELVTYLKANPGKLAYGSSGVGTSQHVYVEMFKNVAGVDVIHVPYKGSGLSVTDLIGGRLAMMIEQGPGVLSHIKGGKLRALGVTSSRRSIALPDVPTIAETIPGFEASTWHAMHGPAGMPRDVVVKLSAEVAKTLTVPEIRNRLIGAGAEPVGSTPEELADQQARDNVKWAQVIKRGNIQLE
jgi:tripartite-type tricarboxylate transporter receptor subunit TctC